MTLVPVPRHRATALTVIVFECGHWMQAWGVVAGGYSWGRRDSHCPYCEAVEKLIVRPVASFTLPPDFAQ